MASRYGDDGDVARLRYFRFKIQHVYKLIDVDRGSDEVRVAVALLAAMNDDGAPLHGSDQSLAYRCGLKRVSTFRMALENLIRDGWFFRTSSGSLWSDIADAEVKYRKEVSEKRAESGRKRAQKSSESAIEADENANEINASGEQLLTKEEDRGKRVEDIGENPSGGSPPSTTVVERQSGYYAPQNDDAPSRALEGREGSPADAPKSPIASSKTMIRPRFRSTQELKMFLRDIDPATAFQTDDASLQLLLDPIKMRWGDEAMQKVVTAHREGRLTNKLLGQIKREYEHGAA